MRRYFSLYFFSPRWCLTMLCAPNCSLSSTSWALVALERIIFKPFPTLLPWLPSPPFAFIFMIAPCLSPSPSPSPSPSLSACFALLLPACPLGFASVRRQNSPYPPPLFKTTAMVEGSCSRDRSSVRVHFFWGGLSFHDSTFSNAPVGWKGINRHHLSAPPDLIFFPLSLWKY